jgi:hypothetical protein
MWAVFFRFFAKLYISPLVSDLSATFQRELPRAMRHIFSSKETVSHSRSVQFIVRLATVTPTMTRLVVSIIKFALGLGSEVTAVIFAGLSSGNILEMVSALEGIQAGEEQRAKDQRENGPNFLDDGERVEPIIEFMLGLSVETAANVLSLCMMFFLWSFSDQLQTEEFGSLTTREFPRYCLFSFVTMIAHALVEPLLINAAENKFGWKLYDFLVYSSYRFQQRETCWKGAEASLEECIKPEVRTLDQLCFSEQYYFIVTGTASAVMLIIWGVQIMVINTYSPFVDYATVFIVILAVSCVYAVKFLGNIIWAHNLIWGIKHEHPAWSIPGHQSQSSRYERHRAEGVSLVYLDEVDIVRLLLFWGGGNAAPFLKDTVTYIDRDTSAFSEKESINGELQQQGNQPVDTGAEKDTLDATTDNTMLAATNETVNSWLSSIDQSESDDVPVPAVAAAEPTLSPSPSPAPPLSPSPSPPLSPSSAPPLTTTRVLDATAEAGKEAAVQAVEAICVNTVRRVVRGQLLPPIVDAAEVRGFSSIVPEKDLVMPSIDAYAVISDDCSFGLEDLIEWSITFALVFVTTLFFMPPVLIGTVAIGLALSICTAVGRWYMLEFAVIVTSILLTTCFSFLLFLTGYHFTYTNVPYWHWLVLCSGVIALLAPYYFFRRRYMQRLLLDKIARRRARRRSLQVSPEEGLEGGEEEKKIQAKEAVETGD